MILVNVVYYILLRIIALYTPEQIKKMNAGREETVIYQAGERAKMLIAPACFQLLI